MFGRAVRGFLLPPRHKEVKAGTHGLEAPGDGFRVGFLSETAGFFNEILMGCLHIFTIYWCGISQPHHPSQGGFVVSL